MNETQVNIQEVINSLVRQIGDQAQKIAFLEALVKTLQNPADTTEDSHAG